MVGIRFLLIGLACIAESKGVPVVEKCCDSKSVGGVDYWLVEEEGNTDGYHCLNNCIYTNSEGARFCFAQGSLSVTCLDCCQQLEKRADNQQFVLKNHTDLLCIYRNISDFSATPTTFHINKSDPNWKTTYKCLDDELKADCSTPKFSSWWDVISRCFHQDTERKELMDPSFCQPTPSPHFIKNFSQTVDKLEDIVNNNKTLGELSKEMWTKSPNAFKDFCPGNFTNMLKYMKIVMRKAPQFMANTTPSGLPQIQMLNCYIRTEAGKKFFKNEEINRAIIAIEQSWEAFLNSEESLDVLNDGQFGWMGKCAQEKLNMNSYKHDPSKPHWGYKSWNAFFARPLSNQTEVRPNRCKGESTCLMSYGDTQKLTIRSNVKLTTKVTAKNEEYSLLDLFAQNQTLANYFLGGTLMQTLFMPFNYHRFHAPVSGKIVYAQVIPGLLYTLYNTSVDETAAGNAPGNTLKEKHFNYWLQRGLYGYINSLTYIAPLATRAVMVIEQEDGFGYVAAIAIGLQSISSCIINDDIIPGVYVEQGHELGRFQYGGSSGIILVSDPHFQWLPGTTKAEDLYMLGDKIGKFQFCPPGSGKVCTQPEDTPSNNYWGTALGFPVI